MHISSAYFFFSLWSGFPGTLGSWVATPWPHRVSSFLWRWMSDLQLVLSLMGRTPRVSVPEPGQYALGWVESSEGEA